MAPTERAYLLLGPETGERDRFLAELRRTLSERGAPEEARFYSFEKGLAEIISILRNGSLFSPHRMIIYQGAEEIRKKEDVELLKQVLASPPEDATLVLVSEKPSLDKKVQDLFRPAQRRVFWELFENQKLGWIIGRLKKNNITIDAAAASALLDTVASTSSDLEKVCAGLALLVGDGGRVSEAQIETYLYHSREENVFTLFERIAGLKLEEALESLQCMLLANENPVQILSGLAWQFRNLDALKSLLAGGCGQQEAFAKLRITSKKSQKVYLEAERNFPRSAMPDLLGALTDCDERLRTNRADLHAHFVQMLVYDLIMNRASRAASRARS